MVLGAGAILLGVMATSAAIAALEEIAGSRALGLVFDYLDPVIGVVFGALAFTVMFSFLPARRVPFREAAVGGITAALLFTAATFALSRYLGSGTIGRGFGAAAALVVLLVFVYYSAQIVLYGAEVSRVWGLRRRPPKPATKLLMLRSFSPLVEKTNEHRWPGYRLFPRKCISPKPRCSSYPLRRGKPLFAERGDRNISAIARPFCPPLRAGRLVPLWFPPQSPWKRLPHRPLPNHRS